MRRSNISLIIPSIMIGMLFQSYITGQSSEYRQHEVVAETENVDIKKCNNVDDVKKETITIVVKDRPEFVLTDSDMELIAKIIHAEAGNQDQIGKRLVADVILNRMESDGFPDTINDVIYQSGQFTQPSIIYTDEDMQAVKTECDKRLDTNALWFKTDNYHDIGTCLYQHGDHYFSGIVNDDKRI